MFYTVYKITNTLNNRYYIGVHKTNKINDSYYGSGIIIKEAIKKYGKENFKKEILFTFDNKDEAYAKEKELVNETTLKDPLIYNVQIGGIPTIDWTADRKQMFSKNMSGINHPHFGKSHSEETKNKIRESAKGRCNKQKGTPYYTEDRLRLYNKRCKYSHPVLWVNDITGERITATCQEMCIKFGKNTSDAKRFTKSIKSLGKLGVWGWRYNNGDSLTTYPE